jgi:hypothetical protein
VDALARPGDSNLNWLGRFSASRRLQLINTRLIPNTALFCSFFLLCCVTCVALCRLKHMWSANSEVSNVRPLKAASVAKSIRAVGCIF